MAAPNHNHLVMAARQSGPLAKRQSLRVASALMDHGTTAVRESRSAVLANGVAITGLILAWVGVNLLMGASEKESADASFTPAQMVEGRLGASFVGLSIPVLVWGVIKRSTRAQFVVSLVGLPMAAFGYLYFPDFVF
jgi:hypothetical protein